MNAARSSAVLYDEYVDPAVDVERAPSYEATPRSCRVGVRSRELSGTGDSFLLSLPLPDLLKVNFSIPVDSSSTLTLHA